MATAARLGAGTTLKRGNGGSPETFTTIPEVKEARLPAIKRPVVDVTSLDSTGGYREYIAGLKDSDEITYTAVRTNVAAQNALYTDMENGTLRNFQLAFPTSPAETYSFAAYVTGWNVYATPDNAIMLDFTLRVSGAVTRS